MKKCHLDGVYIPWPVREKSWFDNVAILEKINEELLMHSQCIQKHLANLHPKDVKSEHDLVDKQWGGYL